MRLPALPLAHVAGSADLHAVHAVRVRHANIGKSERSTPEGFDTRSMEEQDGRGT